MFKYALFCADKLVRCFRICQKVPFINCSSYGLVDWRLIFSTILVGFVVYYHSDLVFHFRNSMPEFLSENTGFKSSAFLLTFYTEQKSVRYILKELF